ncbi:sodium-dependent transporter [Niameybacter massiliensis]|uniref:Sodium-dependent transporter n=1 Tax=Holtiella tumoricola TaxID=3018743 RepID=A0AA42DMU2_9FIRM|nr:MULTISPECIES: sodium-dependent transporter [Lachnospirales]MDA3731875.1 sodium-dependent transporter [Holtiella tumoricola]
MKERESFSNKFGFIISCVGAALGLGNIWMFSYRLGAYGGPVFLIPYFIFVFVLGSTGLIIEFAFGRHFKGGSYTGIREVFKRRNFKGGKVVGLIPPIGLMGVLMFYSVVIGWILKYFSMSVTGELMQINPATYFDSFSGTMSSVPYFFIAMLLTVVIVSLGITKGIEKLNKWIMPLLFVLFIVLTIRGITLPGAMEGVKYLMTPDWSYLLKVETWVMALGQAFFTVSLNGCGMVVYGSYISEKFDIPSAAFSTALFDTLAALLASFMIMPAVFAFGLDPAAGPSLLFITLPQVFQAMPYGNVLSGLFFLSIIFAAISSSVNMLEGSMEAFMAWTKKSRVVACAVIGGISFILALPLATNGAYFGKFADLITIVVSPVAALIVAGVFFYLVDGKEILGAINEGAKRPLPAKFIPFGKYVFVGVTLVVIVLGIAYGGIG